jgi:2-C-methyl-D-erythritol 2,4-cyclodiphosphate synthase
MSFAGAMRKVISAILEITPDDISIKATTTEKLGFIGREEGIMAQAVVLLRKSD